MHLSRFARSVTIVVRRPDLSATMSRYLIDEITYNPVIGSSATTGSSTAAPDGQLAWVDLEDVTSGGASAQGDPWPLPPWGEGAL